jgi:hypothetical protein
MDGWVLLVIGLASLGLIIAAFAYLGYCGYRLGKAGFVMARTYGPPTAELAHKAALATERATKAGLSAEEIATSLVSLQVSLQRLQVAFEALQSALAPYRRVKEYFGR